MLEAQLKAFPHGLHTVRSVSADDNRAIASLCTPEYVGHLSGAPGPMNFEGHKQFGLMFQAAFPDVSHTIEDQIADPDNVVTRVTVRGTHSGDLMGLPRSADQWR